MAKTHDKRTETHACDLISRQAAIETVRKAKDKSEAHRMLIQLPTAQQWIPVTERLPEDVNIGEEYPTVIFCTKDSVYAGFFEHYLGGNWWAAEDYTVDNVIAWMPLPEPWKGEKE